MADSSYMPWITKTVTFGLLAAVAIVFASWGEKLLLYRNTAVPYASVDIRFGPNNTNGINR